MTKTRTQTQTQTHLSVYQLNMYLFLHSTHIFLHGVYLAPPFSSCYQVESFQVGQSVYRLVLFCSQKLHQPDRRVETWSLQPTDRPNNPYFSSHSSSHAYIRPYIIHQFVQLSDRPSEPSASNTFAAPILFHCGLIFRHCDSEK